MAFAVPIFSEGFVLAHHEILPWSSLPEVISDFGPVSKHDNTARSQTKKVFDIVFTLQRKKEKKFLSHYK